MKKEDIIKFFKNRRNNCKKLPNNCPFYKECVKMYEHERSKTTDAYDLCDAILGEIN